MKKITLTLLLTLLPLSSFAQTLGDDSDSSSSNPSCIILKNNFKLGARDTKVDGEVSILQDFLKEQGYYKGSITGYYGSLTKKAVASFQKKKYSNVTEENIDTTLVPDASIRKQLISSASYPNAGLVFTGTGNIGKYTRAKIAYVSCHEEGVSTGAVSVAPTQTITPPATVPAQQVAPSTPVAIPSTCFGRTVKSRIADDGMNQMNGGVGDLASWTNRANLMHIVRFKTDNAGYVAKMQAVYDEDFQIGTFVSASPCDYDWAVEHGTYQSGYGDMSLPVMTGIDAELIAKSAKVDQLRGWSLTNSKRHLLPNTYYYYHVINANIANGSNVKTNQDLALSEELCKGNKGNGSCYYLIVNLYPKFDKNTVIPGIFVRDNQSNIPFPWTIEGKTYSSLEGVLAVYADKGKLVTVDEYPVVNGWPPEIKGSSSKVTSSSQSQNTQGTQSAQNQASGSKQGRYFLPEAQSAGPCTSLNKTYVKNQACVMGALTSCNVIENGAGGALVSSVGTDCDKVAPPAPIKHYTESQPLGMKWVLYTNVVSGVYGGGNSKKTVGGQCHEDNRYYESGKGGELKYGDATIVGFDGSCTYNTCMNLYIHKQECK